MTVERSLLAVRNLRIARDDVASAPAVADTFFCGLGGFYFEIKADPEATDPPVWGERRAVDVTAAGREG